MVARSKMLLEKVDVEQFRSVDEFADQIDTWKFVSQTNWAEEAMYENIPASWFGEKYSEAQTDLLDNFSEAKELLEVDNMPDFQEKLAGFPASENLASEMNTLINPEAQVNSVAK